MVHRILLVFFCVSTCWITPAERKVTDIAALRRACPCSACLEKQPHPYTEKERGLLELLRDLLRTDPVVALALGYCDQNDFGQEWIEIAGKVYSGGCDIPGQKKSHLIMYYVPSGICVPPELTYEDTKLALILESKDIVSRCQQYKATITQAPIEEKFYEKSYAPLPGYEDWRYDLRARYIKYHYALATFPRIMEMLTQKAPKK